MAQIREEILILRLEMSEFQREIRRLEREIEQMKSKEVLSCRELWTVFLVLVVPLIILIASK